MDTNTEDPTQAMRPYRQGPAETALDRHRLSTQSSIKRESRLSSIVRLDATAFFRNNCEEGLRQWLSLLQATTFPPTVASSDPCFLEAFATLDSAIAGSQTSRTLAGFAHFRLVQVYGFLTDVIESEREKGQVCRERGRRNASYALDVYSSAQKYHLGRTRLIDRMRLSRRWATLAGPSPFFLMIYACAAQVVV